MELFLKQSARELHIPRNKIKYFGKHKNSWQVEVPDNCTVPSSWLFNSKKKGFKRYYPRKVQAWKTRLETIDEGLKECQSNRLRILFRTFSRTYPTWKMALKCIARLDALMSLVSYCNFYVPCAHTYVGRGTIEMS